MFTGALGLLVQAATVTSLHRAQGFFWPTVRRKRLGSGNRLLVPHTVPQEYSWATVGNRLQEELLPIPSSAENRLLHIKEVSQAKLLEHGRIVEAVQSWVTALTAQAVVGAEVGGCFSSHPAQQKLLQKRWELKPSGFGSRLIPLGKKKPLQSEFMQTQARPGMLQ